MKEERRARKLERAGLESMLEHGLEKPLVIEFTYGADFDFTFGSVNRLAMLEQCIQARMPGLVEVRRTLDRQAKGCARAKVHLGIGIDVWVSAKMMMFRENPFATLGSIEVWVKQMSETHIPLLIRVMNL
jgi:hypothetical protein